MTDPMLADLLLLAREMRENAYAPYSKYRVGAAVLTDDGRLFGGCNVENVSYGLTNCAERTAIFTAVAQGARGLRAVAVATENGGSPCGACRQVLAEFAPKDGGAVPVYLLNAAGAVVGESTVAALLPDGFSAWE
jgi:cytidine deaminase